MGSNTQTRWPYLFKEVGIRTAARKRREGLCKHWGCNNQARYTKRDCETCHCRKKQLKHPVRYAFYNVRRSAKKRNIPFNLTFEQFQQFDEQTGYVESKGQDKESLTIDRIDSSKGYEINNIRALTMSENSAKKVEGMTDPIEPIAKALCLAKQDTNWHKYKKQAVGVLQQVEILQAQEEGGFEPPTDECPF